MISQKMLQISGPVFSAWLQAYYKWMVIPYSPAGRSADQSADAKKHTLFTEKTLYESTTLGIPSR